MRVLGLLISFFLLTYAKNPFSGQLQGKLNIINGASAECVMHRFYTNSGWIQIEGEVGRNGIDGLYFKKRNNVIGEVLVTESKWNTSRLELSGKGKTIKQMSHEWVIRTLKRLHKYKPMPEYASILKLVKNGQYRARLFRLKPIGDESIQISIYKIKNKGLKTFEKIKERQLKPININHPENSFEKGIVKAYNDCRREYLYQYFRAVNENQMSVLLQDNYIQTDDMLPFI